MKCIGADYTWGPHEGCREFMDEPEEWPCREDAQYLVVQQEATWDGISGSEELCTYSLCERHANELDVQDPYVLTQSRWML